MALTSTDLLMLDASTLFSEDGIDLLADPTTSGGFVVGLIAAQVVRGESDLDPSRFLAPEDSNVFEQRREQLIALLEGVPTFSYQEVEARLSTEHNSVLFNLLRDEGGLGLYADEWAFLQAHSFLISKLRNVIDAFRDAGCVIVEWGQRAAEKAVRQVIQAENVPRVLTARVLARAGGKWLVVGGAAIGGGTLGGMVGTAVGGPMGGFLGHKAAGLFVEEAVRSAVLAIDP